MKLLTVAIPTFQRPFELSICLRYIANALGNLEIAEKDSVEVRIFDNSEDDNSKELFRSDEFAIFHSGYHKNSTNIGSDENIAQCYLQSTSLYVMALGDDDYLQEDFFKKILPLLAQEKFSLVTLNVYGFMYNHEENRPFGSDQVIKFTNASDIVVHRNIHLTFISGLILRRDLLSEASIKRGIGTQLVQVNAAFAALSVSPNSAFVTKYLLSSTRNNTGGYNPVDIFVARYFELLDSYNFFSMNRKQMNSLKLRLLIGFYSRSFAQFIRSRNLALSDQELTEVDRLYKDTLLYRLIIRNLFKSTASLSFYILTGIYILSNIILSPIKIFYYSRHACNILVKSIKKLCKR